MEKLDVHCRPEGSHWVCSVTVGSDPRATHHEVTVTHDLMSRLRPGTSQPGELVRDSFIFLLEREPRAAILRTFDLPVIGRYFPEWEGQVRR